MDKSVTGLSEFVGAFDDDGQILRVCPVDVVIHGVRDHPRGFADVEEPAVAVSYTHLTLPTICSV